MREGEEGVGEEESVGDGEREGEVWRGRVRRRAGVRSVVGLGTGWWSRVWWGKGGWLGWVGELERKRGGGRVWKRGERVVMEGGMGEVRIMG
uniref:hypothetical protein n=1 Tax=Rhodococcus hoagii TaxID=43767 RepID=UPI001C92DEC8